MAVLLVLRGIDGEELVVSGFLPDQSVACAVSGYVVNLTLAHGSAVADACDDVISPVLALVITMLRLVAEDANLIILPPVDTLTAVGAFASVNRLGTGVGFC